MFTKILNRNTIKVSYGWVPNIHVATIIKYNNKILKSEQKSNGRDNGEKTYNCRDKQVCPLDGKCLVQDTVYEAKITTGSDMDNECMHTRVASTKF